ncbi:MAG TPA: beta-ketoacyl synthase N-terminal-like domain-containing protein, partial [Prosthecobacter sp.]|nr:beta-ketoacyl synthase N-terminal-like domain-containing protein [Prosthecobacter sp.]
RALVVAVDLPLTPQLLKDFEETRLLSVKGGNDPLSPETDGFIPGEAAAAVTLDVVRRGGICEVASYGANSDAYDSLSVPANGAPLADLINKICGTESPDVICPHATGTANHAVGEVAALRRAFPAGVPPLLLLKPFTGHTLAASGLLDVALIAGGWKNDLLRMNYRVSMPEGFSRMVKPGAKTCLKIASGMGGHNAAVILRKTCL